MCMLAEFVQLGHLKILVFLLQSQRLDQQLTGVVVSLCVCVCVSMLSPGLDKKNNREH